MQIGLDLVHLDKFKEKMAQGPAVSVFTAVELQQNTSTESLAGVFAAKEAFMKALGRQVDWQEVWVEKQDSGQPVLFSNLLAEGQSAGVSISHDGSYAAAVVIIY